MTGQTGSDVHYGDGGYNDEEEEEVEEEEEEDNEYDRDECGNARKKATNGPAHTSSTRQPLDPSSTVPALQKRKRLGSQGKSRTSPRYQHYQQQQGTDEPGQQQPHQKIKEVTAQNQQQARSINPQQQRQQHHQRKAQQQQLEQQQLQQRQEHEQKQLQHEQEQQRQQEQEREQQRQHAHTEKRYRSVINSKIQRLSELIPPSNTFDPANLPPPQQQQQQQAANATTAKVPTKSVVLDRALLYMNHLVSTYEGYEREREELRRRLQVFVDDVLVENAEGTANGGMAG